jgi:hypothetical protein
LPIKYENDHESLFQRAFSVQYNGKKMKKFVIFSQSQTFVFILVGVFRLEKEYTVIRKEEQEEQIEIRVCTLDLLPCFIYVTFEFFVT